MPSKRTNDSVDRILADLNQRQAADGVRASVTDHQVDEILRSVGISTTPLQNTPTQDSQIAFSDFSGPDDFDEIMRSAGATSAPASMPAPAPRRTTETPRAAAPQRMPSRLPPLRPQCVRPSPCSLCKMCSLPGRCSNPPPPRAAPRTPPAPASSRTFCARWPRRGMFPTPPR